MNGLTAYALSKKYTNDTVDGLGYLKGAPCTIKSTTETDDGVVIVFEWTGTSGVTQTSSILIKNGEDGQAQTITTARTVDDDGVVITVVNPDGSIASTATIYDGDSGEVTSIDWSKIENRPFVTLSADDFEVNENGVLSVVTNGEGNKINSISVNGVNVEIDTNKNVDITVPDTTDLITKAVSDLENYYLKTDTYTQTEVNDLISAIVTLNISVVDVLPTTEISTTTIYLVAKTDTEEQNVYSEYICLDSTVPTWEKIGSTKVDLTDYVKSEKLTEELENYVLKVDGKGLSTHDLTDELLEKITQNDNIIEISKADYDLLTDEEKRDKIYYVYDDENGVLTWNTLSGKPFESIDVESFDISEDGVLSLKGGYVKTDDVEQMFKDELYTSTTTPSHYELADSTTPNALEVVADGTATDSQIDLSNVADIGASIGDFVVFVDEVTTTDTKYAEKTNVYSKSETDEKIAEAVTGGTVSLDGYVQKTELETTLEGYTTDDELTTALADYTKTTELDTKLEDYVLDSDMEIIDLATLESMLELSTEELEGLAQIIDDSQIVLNKTYSSSKIYSSIAQCLEDSKAYTLSELSKAIGASYKVVTSVDQMTDSKVLYLLKDADSGMYNIYVYDADTSTAELIGSFEINLDDYLKISDAEAQYVKQTDLVANYATKQELTNAIADVEVEVSQDTDNQIQTLDDGLFVGSETVTISKADYDALSIEEKSNGKTYFVPDDETTEDGIDLTQFAKVSELEETNNKIEEINTDLGKKLSLSGGEMSGGIEMKGNTIGSVGDIFLNDKGAFLNALLTNMSNNLAQLIKTTTVTASADIAANSSVFMSVSPPETPSGYRRLFAFIQGGSGSIDTSQLLIGSGTTGCRVYNNLSQKQTVTIECQIVYIKNC